RLIGSTPIFLSRTDTLRLVALSGSAGPSPGAGPFVLSSSVAATVAYLDVSIKKANRTRVHDLIWRMMFDLIRDLAALSATGSEEREKRLLNALERTSNILGPTWPSELRNLVNYAPGRGYGAARRQTRISAFSNLRVDPPSKFDAALDELENNV